MKLEDFIEMIERERPSSLTSGDVSRVTPQPWILRAGNGDDARIRMHVGGVRYERKHGETTWHLARVSDFDADAA